MFDQEDRHLHRRESADQIAEHMDLLVVEATGGLSSSRIFGSRPARAPAPRVSGANAAETDMGDVVKAEIARISWTACYFGLAAATQASFRESLIDVQRVAWCDQNVVEHRKIWGTARRSGRYGDADFGIRCGGRLRMLWPSIRMSPALGW